jgi:hypothetical protein
MLLRHVGCPGGMEQTGRDGPGPGHKLGRHDEDHENLPWGVNQGGGEDKCCGNKNICLYCGVGKFDRGEHKWPHSHERCQ